MNQEPQDSVEKDTASMPSSRGGRRTGAGRKPIGVTRKVSLTLPESCWAEIDRRSGGDYSVSEILRSIVEDYLRDVDHL